MAQINREHVNLDLENAIAARLVSKDVKKPIQIKREGFRDIGNKTEHIHNVKKVISKITQPSKDLENANSKLVPKKGANDKKTTINIKREGLKDGNKTAPTQIVGKFVPKITQPSKIIPSKSVAAASSVLLKKLPSSKIGISNKENIEIKDATKKISNLQVIRQESIKVPKPSALIRALNGPLQKTTDILPEYDPDDKHRDNPFMVTEYVHDILAYLRGIENDFPIAEKFLNDKKITASMRATLVNWLVEVHASFNLEIDTLYLCISLTDRYLQVNQDAGRSILQLIGTVALMMACKHEEIYYPDISEFVHICDDAFSTRHMLKMETEIAKGLEFRLGWPLSIYFLRRYNAVAEVENDEHILSKYILELGLLEDSMSQVKPSIQAAAVCFLSMAIWREEQHPTKIWKPILARHTTYEFSDFKQILPKFAQFILKAEISKFTAVKDKYASSKFHRISLNSKLQQRAIIALSQKKF